MKARHGIARAKKALKAVLVCTLLLTGYVAWSGFTDRELIWPVSTVIDNGPEVTGSDPGYDDLRVRRGSTSWFGGTITVENPTDAYQDVLVTVDLFDDDQNVGDLTGSVTLKPNSESSVALTSVDDYVPWDNAHVDLLRLPS